MRINIINKLIKQREGFKMKTRIWRRVYYFSVALLGSLSFLLTPVTKVFATSIYDDFYQNVSSVGASTINYQGNSCSNVDVTNTWKSYILDKSKWASPTYNGDADVSFRNALANGRWAVSTYSQKDSATTYHTSTYVVWTEDDSLELDWDSDYDWVTMSGDAMHYIWISTKAVISGNGYDCDAVAWNYSSSSPLVVISSEIPFSNTPSSYAWANLSVYSDYLNYPEDYDGDSIPSGSSIVPISGNATCGYGNNTITEVSIDAASGADGDATISDDGIGGKNYEYYLSEDSSYHLDVTCSASVFISPTVSTSLYSHRDWVCTVQSLQYICASA